MKKVIIPSVGLKEPKIESKQKKVREENIGRQEQDRVHQWRYWSILGITWWNWRKETESRN